MNVFMSGARQVGVTRAAVWNAVDRGSLKAAAWVDDTPVFDATAVAAWRAGNWKRRRNRYGEPVSDRRGHPGSTDTCV